MLLCYDVYVFVGQQYNKYGNRVQWWADQSIANFKERAQCFVNQYGRYQQQGYRVTLYHVTCS